MGQSLQIKKYFKKLVLALFIVLSYTINSYAQNCTVNAGVLNVTICETDALVLEGSTPSPITGTVLWSQISGPAVVINSPNSTSTTVSGYTGGNTYIFRYSAVCGDGILTYQDKVVNVKPITVAQAGGDVASCPNSAGTLTITANTPQNTGETAYWEIVGNNNAGVVINFPNLPTSTINLPATSCGVTTLQWVIEGPELAPGIRCRTTSQITVTNYGGVKPISAGPNQTLSNCYTTTQSTNLSGTYGGCGLNGQGGLWTFVSGPNTPTINDPTSNTTQISNLTEGTYTFRWTVTGPCASGNASVTIIVPPATQDVTTLPGGAENIFFCDNTITQVTLVAQTPLYAGETVQWTQIAGDTGAQIISPTNPTTLVKNISDSGDPYTFRYTLTNANTGCVFTKDYNVQYNGATRTIVANNGNDIVGSCNATVFTIPLTVTGTGVNQYRITHGPDNSPLAPFPTALKDVGNSLTLTLTTPGDYIVEFVRSQNGSLNVACDYGFDTLNILVSGAPTPSNAGSDVSLPCGDTTTMLSGVMTDDGLHFWSQLNGPNEAIIADVFATDTQVSGLIPGTYVFQYITKGGGATCGFSVSTVTIYVSGSTLSNTDAGPDHVVCTKSDVPLTAKPAESGEIGGWSQVSGPDTLIFSNVHDPNAIVSGLLTSNAVYELKWTISYLHPGPTCGADVSDNMLIYTTNSIAPTSSDAGPDTCYPNGTNTFNLSGNTPEGQDFGTWTVSPSAGVVIANINDPNTLVTVPSDGTYTFTWAIANRLRICIPSTSSVKVTIAGTPPAADAGLDQETCGSVITMAATISSGATGTWTRISGAGNYTISDPHDPNAVFTFTFSGYYIFRWTVSADICGEAFDDINLTIGIPPHVAAAGPDQNVCNNTTVTMAGNAYDSFFEDGQWSVLTGAPNQPNIVNPSNPNTVINGLVKGTYTFRWTINAKSVFLCPPTFDDVIVTVLPAANAGPDKTYCDVTSIQLIGNENSTGTWTLTTTSGNVNDVVITQSPPNSYIANATVVPGNTYVFTYTISSSANPVCPGSSDDVNIDVFNGASVDPNAGADQNLCITDVTGKTILDGNLPPPDVSKAEWRFVYQPSGSVAVIETPTAPKSNLLNLTVPGLYILEWVFESTSCRTLSDIVRIEMNAPPSTAEAGPNDTAACQTTYKTAALPPAVGIGTWSFALPADDPSNGSVVIDNPNSPVTTLSNITTLGTYILTWTVTNGSFTDPSSCQPSVDKVSITFNDIPPSKAEAGPDQELCNVDSTTMAAVPVTSGIGTWTKMSGPAVNIGAPNDPNSIMLGLQPGTYEFLWTVTTLNNNGCISEDSVIVTIYDQPSTADAGPNQIVPQFSPVNMNALPPTVGTGEWTQITGPSTLGFVDSKSPTTAVSGTIAGTYQFQWTVSNGNCAVSSDVMTLTILSVSDLELTKSVSPTHGSVGDVVTFTIQIFNNNSLGGTVTATGVAVRDYLPTGFTIVPGSANLSGQYNVGDNTLTWYNLTIPNGGRLNLTFKATINTVGSTLNKAEIVESDQFDPDSTPNNQIETEDDQDSVSVSIDVADLSLQKTVSPTSVSINDNVIFTIRATNSGPNNATGVTVSDKLPPGYTYVSDNGSGKYNSTTGIWNIGNLNNGNSITLQITAKVNVATAANYKNTAEIQTARQFDPDSTPGNGLPEDDMASANITLKSADLELTKTVTPTSAASGQQVDFILNLINKGPGNATGIAVQDVIPVGYTLIPGSVSIGGTYQVATATLEWKNIALANGANTNLTFSAFVNPLGSYKNVAQITASDLPDPDSTPNNDDGDQSEDDESNAEIIYIGPSADLSLVKKVVAGNTSPVVGSQISFELIIQNDGPNSATGIEVKDLLPTGYEFVNYSSSAGLYNNTTGIWNVGTVDKGVAESLIIDVKVLPTGDYKNIAQVTASSLPDPDSTPNNDDGDQSEDDEANAIVTPIQPTADLSLTKSVNRSSPLIGSKVTFEIIVTNNGPNDNTGVQVTDKLPSGYTYDSFTVSTGTYDPATGVWIIGNLVNGKFETLQVTAVVNPTGVYLNSAEVTASDLPDPDSTPNNKVTTEDDYAEISTTPVTAVSDLSLTKTVNNTNPTVGSLVTFTIIVTNGGPQDNTGVEVTDLLPSGYTYNNFTLSTGAYNPTTGVWTVGNLVNGKFETLQITARVNASGNYTNSTEITAADLPDPDSTPNNGNTTEDDYSTATTVPIYQSSDLSLTKTVNNATPLVGTLVTFEVIVTNNGPQDNTGVQVKDLLPSGYILNGYTISTGTYNSTTGIWNVGNLINGKSETLQIIAMVNPAGDYTNIVEITAADLPDSDSTPNNGITTEDDYAAVSTTPINKSSDLSLSKIVNNATPVVGSVDTFEIVVTNSGPQDNTGVQVTDLLPSGYTYSGFTVSTGTYNPTTGIWNIGNLNNGKSETLQITAIINPTGNYVNSAEITAADLPDPDSTPNNGVTTEDDYDTAFTVPILRGTDSDLSLTKKVNNATPLVGSQVIFEIIISNNGPLDNTGVKVRDLLPSGYTFNGYSISTGTYDSTTGVWTVGGLVNGKSETLEIMATVNPNGDYTNVAEVIAADIKDPDSTPNNGVVTEDDYSTATTTPINQTSDLSLTKTVDNAAPIIDTEVTFEIVITNSGPQDNTGVQVTDLLPVGFTFNRYTVSTGTYNATTGLWNVGNLRKGQSETLQINAIASIVGEFVNTTEVIAADLPDPDSTPNNGITTEDDFASVKILIVDKTPPPPPFSDLSITKSVNNATPLVGSQVTFEVVVTNGGKDTNTNVQITDLLPSGYTYNSFTISTGTYNPSTGLWTVGNLINGKSETLQVTATVNPAGNYTNIAEVTAADLPDPDSTPNNGVTTEDDYATVSTTPTNQASNLSLTKTVNNPTPLIGAQVTFEIVVTNSGPQNTSGVQVKDLLPPGYTFSSFTATKGSYNKNTGIWNIGSFVNGDSHTLQITAIVNAAGNYLNIAEVTASNMPDPNSTPNNGVATEDDYATAFVTPSVLMADLSISKTTQTGKTIYEIGSTVIFNITVTNDGPGDASGVKVKDLLPAGFTYLTNSATSGIYNYATGIWTTGTVNNGETQTLDIYAKVNPPTGAANEYTNETEIIASNMPDPDSTPNNGVKTEDDYDSIQINVSIADLSLDKTVSNKNPNVDEVITFTLQLNNEGPSQATGVAVDDIIPLGYRNITNISNGGLFRGNIIKWTNLTVPVGGITLTYQVTVASPHGLDGYDYLNVAQVTASDQYDPDSKPNNDNGDQSEDDEDSEFINISSTDIAINKEVDKTDVPMYSTVTFTITAENLGNLTATNVEVQDILPKGYKLDTFTVSSGVYNSTTGTWTIPSVAVKGSQTLTITAKVVDFNDYLNTAHFVKMDQIDSNSSNNQDSATVAPNCLKIFNEFSPNDDGQNDTFYIDCISQYPDNQLEIFNRWGNLVYYKKGYNNTWDGKADGSAKTLPEGTYFYILDLGNGSPKTSGWLYLK
ncbi:gliding motility-associated C-terminal domain-containing protein [Flavobacterium sp. YO64]|nr:gliding motility-associated C-terminal domain-containing protein [Flavobacterium sp. YO64]RXM44993.1 hypothetical protein BOW57_06765 [Flavobacterium sp. YO64]